MNLTPLGDRVIVKAVEQEEVSAGGIVLPDTAKEKPRRGRVLAVGQGRYEDGEWIPLDVTEGDEVVYSKYGGSELKVEGEEILILGEHDILAKVMGGSSARRAGAPTSAAAKAAPVKGRAKPAARSAGRAAK
jgi:chaperonin GroES